MSLSSLNELVKKIIQVQLNINESPDQQHNMFAYQITSRLPDSLWDDGKLRHIILLVYTK